MFEKTPTAWQSRQSSVSGGLLPALGLSLFAVCYLIAGVLVSRHVHLWMDEILTLWAVREHSPTRIYYALEHGSEFAPPLYPVFLLFFGKLAGYSTTALRLPSIVADLGTGAASFLLLRRYLGLTRAAFGVCLIMVSLFDTVGIQIRPYAMVVTCFALAVLLWDNYSRTSNRMYCAGIALVLTVAIALHFYSVLLVAGVGLIELLYVARARRFQVELWLSLALAGASVLIWRPLMHNMAHYVANDFNAPDYYARPTIQFLALALSSIFMAKDAILFAIMPALLMIAIGRLFFPTQRDEAPSVQRDQTALWAITLGAMAYPIIVFTFSKVATHTFNLRYTYPAILGSCFLLAALLPVSSFFRRMLPAYLLTASLGILIIAHSKSSPHQEDKDLTPLLRGSEPVVVADGLQFFPMLENSAPALQSRVVYVTLPRNEFLRDATNTHQIERWKAINLQLPVEDVDSFLREHPDFYLVDQQTSDDTPMKYLWERHKIELVSKEGSVLIYHSFPH